MPRTWQQKLLHHYRHGTLLQRLLRPKNLSRQHPNRPQGHIAKPTHSPAKPTNSPANSPAKPTHSPAKPTNSPTNSPAKPTNSPAKPPHSPAKPTNSSRRLNALYAEMPACTDYLEVGVYKGRTFHNVEVPFRWGVDPVPKFNVGDLPQGVRFSTERSDDFFRALPRQHYFDLVFLDGLHEWLQTYKDLINTLSHTQAHAIVLIDDVVPDDEWSAIPDQELAIEKKREAGSTDRRWQGDVFKVMVAIRDRHPELDYAVIGEAGPGDNLQALVWRRTADRREYSLTVSDSWKAELDSLTYADVFVDGKVPADFKPTNEAAGIRLAIEGSWAAWSRP